MIGRAMCSACSVLRPVGDELGAPIGTNCGGSAHLQVSPSLK